MWGSIREIRDLGKYDPFCSNLRLTTIAAIKVSIENDIHYILITISIEKWCLKGKLGAKWIIQNMD